MTETTKYRLGVRDTDAIIFWYDQENRDNAYAAWKLLDAYGREGVTASVQQLDPEGQWVTVIGDSFPGRELT